MAINSPLNIAAQPGKTRLRKSLKLWQVVMMGLAYLTPMTVFDSFGIVSGISDGHVPASYLLALAGVLFTAISYGKLVRQFPEAGSAYTYAQKSINPHVGFMVGWSSLLDYLFLPMINVLLAKIYLSALFPEVPPWVWVVTFVAILTAAISLSRRRSLCSCSFPISAALKIRMPHCLKLRCTSAASSSSRFSSAPRL